MVPLPPANQIHNGCPVWEIDDASLQLFVFGPWANRSPVYIFMRIDKSSFSDAARNGVDGQRALRTKLCWT